MDRFRERSRNLFAFMATITVARRAMATRFEIVLRGRDEHKLRAAGEAALDEIERLEAQLSLYQPSSEVSHINARAGREPVRVEPSLFRLLERAKLLSEETGGAFDITVAPLMRAWGLMGGQGKLPSADELKKARASVGMHLVDLHDFTVRFRHPGVMLDLGAIGKGHAIEQAVEILREGGVRSALIHGGTSTVFALGPAPWKVAIPKPDEQSTPVAVLDLQNEALSVSAIWGKSFKAGRKTYGHIIDPRLGSPVGHTALAAVVLRSPTETDALSTALLTLGSKGQKALQILRPGIRSLIIEPRGKGYKVISCGISAKTPPRRAASTR